MTDQKTTYYFTEATEADGPDVLHILEQQDLERDLDIIYTRRPNPVKSLQAEGDDVIIIVAKLVEDDSVIGFGSCSINDHYLGSEVQRLAYLSGFRVKKEYETMANLLKEAYKVLLDKVYEHGVNQVYTVVPNDRAKLQKVLEDKENDLPDHLSVGNCHVHWGTVKMSPYKGHKYQVTLADQSDLTELVAFLNKERRKSDLFPYITEETLNRGSALNLHYSHYYVAKSLSSNRIVAAVYVWQQAHMKQHVLHSSKGIYRFLRHFGDLLPYTGYPKLPDDGSVLDYYTLSFYAYNDQHLEGLEAIIRTVANDHPYSNHYVMGTVSGTEEDRLLKKLTKKSYGSRVYMVDGFEAEESRKRVKAVKDLYLEWGML